MRLFLSILLAFNVSTSLAITATKAYVDAATNDTLNAAKAYTDVHGGGGGGGITNRIADAAGNEVWADGKWVNGGATNWLADTSITNVSVPWTKDRNGNRTALTVGTKEFNFSTWRNKKIYSVGDTAIKDSVSYICVENAGPSEWESQSNCWKEVVVGEKSVLFGDRNITLDNALSHGRCAYAVGDYSHAEGRFTTAIGDYSHVDGIRSISTNSFSYVWQGDESNKYYDHGAGTYNINPVGGIRGFWIGETNLADYISTHGGVGGGGITNRIADASGNEVWADGRWVNGGVTNWLATTAVTNGLVTAAVTNGLVTAAVTNGLVTAAVTNGLVTAAVTNGLVHRVVGVEGLDIEYAEDYTITGGGINIRTPDYSRIATLAPGYISSRDGDYTFEFSIFDDHIYFWCNNNEHSKDYNFYTYNSTNYFTDPDAVMTRCAVTNIVALAADYALKNLTGTTVSLASGTIGNASMSGDLAVTLDFSTAANRSGDCLLYLINATANDHDIVPTQTNAWSFVSTDLATALTIGKATTNLVMFSRVAPNTINVSKQELK